MRSEHVLTPECNFDALRNLLAKKGWQALLGSGRPILPGEPEVAVFERAAQERMHYTFNPVCHLRVLELPDDLDPVTRAVLPTIGVTEITSWLDAEDERVLLRGVLAARLQPDAGLIARVETLQTHPQRAIAQGAIRAVDAIRAANPSRPPEEDPRLQALAAIEVVKAQVTPLLQAVCQDPTGTVVETVRPREEDYDKAFVTEVAARARQAYESVWAQTFEMRRPDATQSLLICEVAPAGMLLEDNELSRCFPGGYRKIAQWLDPRRVWVRWKFVQPGESAGMAYDGLVWIDDHWAWFPKPYRVLAPLLNGLESCRRGQTI